MAIAAWLALISLFASTLAKSFLQAVGLAIATFFCCLLLIPVFFTSSRVILFDLISVHSILPLVITVPTLIVTLLWLAYLNFKNFRDGWPLWRRNLLGFAGAFVFILVTTAALYNRAWEVFEPAEPAHGAVRLSLANPPTLKMVQYNNLLVRLPDGRVWFDYLDYSYNYYDGDPVRWRYLWRMLTHPADRKCRAAAVHCRFKLGGRDGRTRCILCWNISGKQFFASGFMETVGIQPDGTLWISEKPGSNKLDGGDVAAIWRRNQLAASSSQSRTSILLLKSDGTLWRWGLPSYRTNCINGRGCAPSRRIKSAPIPTGRNFSLWAGFVPDKRTVVCGSLNVNWKRGRDELYRMTNYDEIVSQTASSRAGDEQTAFVRADGTLWVLNQHWDEKTRQTMETGFLQVGKENDWRAVAVNYGRMVALKSDGSLWQWGFSNSWNMTQEQFILATQKPPARLGIHNDWVAIASSGKM